MVKALLAAPGIGVNQANKDGETPLHSASGSGVSEVVEALLAAPGIDVNQADQDGRTPLVAARIEKRAEVVRILEAAGAQANYTLLSACCEGNLNEVARLLRTPRADVNQANKDGETPLYWASVYGHTEVVKALLAAPGIDVNQADKYGNTPLSVADNEEIRALLLAAGARA